MFGTFTLAQVATSLEIMPDDVRRLITAGEFPQPDAGAPQNWEWQPSTVATAFASLTPAGIRSFLIRALAPLPDGTATIKPWMQGVPSFN